MPRMQRGVSLFIALIVLVGMTLSGFALLRSVDTNTLISGNLAFKQSTIQAADQGTEAAYQWLVANVGTTVLNNTNAAAGYYSAHPAIEPDWNDPAVWVGAVDLPADAAGNAVSYVVHRMCTQPDTPYNGTNGAAVNECAMTYVSGSSSSGGSMAVDSPAFLSSPHLFYRVTSRTAGPRGTFSVTQAVVRVSI
jgi:Tfp pilus assembly protein PilX